ncbi:MAG: hypothetical protein KGJ60_06070, partial [Verrucomicrobiota bacterium]|nr:hypothetical protein [Verrucomicrobiota bacterium]
SVRKADVKRAFFRGSLICGFSVPIAEIYHQDEPPVFRPVDEEGRFHRVPFHRLREAMDRPFERSFRDV